MKEEEKGYKEGLKGGENSNEFKAQTLKNNEKEVEMVKKKHWMNDYLVFLTVGALSGKFFLEFVLSINFESFFTSLVIGAIIGIAWNYFRVETG